MKYALHFAVAAFATAFACATPTEYRDGPMVRPAPVRPVPGYAPPGTGLPEYMPMPEPPAYPRSPYKRYLPPEPDGQPGIWASETPPQSPMRNQPAPPLVVLGEELPHPPSIKTAWDAQLAMRCAMAIDTGAAIARVRGRVAALPKEERRCLAALMQFACMKWIEDLWTGGMAGRRERGEPEHLVSHELRARARDSKSAAFDIYNECGQMDALSDEGKILVTMIRDARPDPITTNDGGSLQ